MEEKKVLSFSDLDDEFQFDGVLYFDTAGRSAIPRCVEEEGVKGFFFLFFSFFFFFFSFFFFFFLFFSFFFFFFFSFLFFSFLFFSFLFFSFLFFSFLSSFFLSFFLFFSFSFFSSLFQLTIFFKSHSIQNQTLGRKNGRKRHTNKSTKRPLRTINQCQWGITTPFSSQHPFSSSFSFTNN